MNNLINCLVPDSTDECLVASVNQPLKVIRDQSVGKDYLLCGYNRNGDSYRSPWTNIYTPSSDGMFEMNVKKFQRLIIYFYLGNLPSNHLRQLEVDCNLMFEQCRKTYFEGDVSSVYLWDLENGFAGVVLIKKFYDGNSTNEGCWDSIHVFVVEEKQNARSAHYKLTSTVML